MPFHGNNNPNWIHPSKIRFSCTTCRQDLSLNQRKMHQCSGPYFEHPDKDDIIAYWKRQKGTKQDKWQLTARDVAQLLEEAGILVYQIGRYKGNYHMARHGDKGIYEMGNCRFLSCTENIQEMGARGAPKRWKRCLIMGVEYESQRAASEALGLPQQTVSKRLLNPNKVEWTYI